MSLEMRALARRIKGIETQVRGLAVGPQLAHSSIEEGGINEYAADGTLMSRTGAQYDGSSMSASLNGPIPPTPTAPNVAGVVGGLVVGWNGGFANAIAAPMDFVRVDVCVGAVGGFDVLATPPLSAILSPRGGEVFIALDPGIYGVALLARSLSGQPSLPSTPTAGESYALIIPPLSDGLPPASSPTPVALSGIGSVFLRWDGVTNADPVIYDIHVSTDIAMVAGPTTLLASTPATIATVRTLVDGTPLTYGTTYYFAIIARDKDGSAAASATVPGTPGQANGPDISANFAYLGQVAANQITTGDLSAVIALLGSLTVGGASGARIAMDPTNGFTLFAPDDVPLIRFPVDGSNNIFDGDIVARGLTTLGRASFRGNDNEISRGSSFTLANGTTHPSSGPSATTLPQGTTVTQTYTLPAGILANRNWSYGSCVNAGVLAKLSNVDYGFFGPFTPDLRIDQLTLSTLAHTRSTALALPAGMTSTFANSFGPATNGLGGVLKIGTEWFAMILCTDNARTTFSWRVIRYSATFAMLGNFTWTSVANPTDPTITRPSISTDGTYIYIGENLSEFGKFRVKKYTTTGTLSTTTDSVTNMTGWASLNSEAGNFDFGSFRWMLQVGTKVYPMDATGNVNTLESWAGDRTFYYSGAFHNIQWTPGSWYASEPERSTGVVVTSTYSTLTSGKNLVIAQSWYDNDAGGTGTHETDISPTVAFTQLARAGVRFSTGYPADSGDMDSPNSTRLYVGLTAGDLHLVETIVGGGNSAQYTAIPLTGAAPITVNTFPDGISSELKSTLSGFVVRGDGSGAWPYLEGFLVHKAGVEEITGAKTFSATETNFGISPNQSILLKGGAISHGVEIGRIDGVASTPYIDFHSGATATDRDVRLIASGGTGVADAGTLSIGAAKVAATGSVGAARGAVGAAAFHFDTDTNTGMYSPAENEVAFVAGGGQKLKVTVDGVTAQNMTPVTATGGGATSTTLATYVVLSPSVGLTFVAPLSGRIMVHIVMYLQGGATTTGCKGSYEIKTGGVIGSGTSVIAAGDSFIDNRNPAWARLGGSFYHAGLTPGSTYNARLVFASGVAGTSVSASASDLTVQPIL